MARSQIVVKKSEATKQTKDQNNNKTKNKNKTTQNNSTKQKNGKGNFILQVLFHRLFREIHLKFIWNILFYRFYFTRVQNRSWRSNFLDLHTSFSTLFTSSIPVCFSGLLQLYSSSFSLHPSSGTCPQPLPSCMCTGGVVRSFTSRLGQPLSGLTATPRRQCTICRQVLSLSFQN